MNKDTVIASSIGFGLGLIAAIALWVVPRIMPKTPANNNSARNVVASAASSPVTLAKTSELEITTPKDGEIFKTNSVKLTAKTNAQALVTISTPDFNKVVTAGNDGLVNTDLNLKEGNNQINVTSFDNGAITSRDLEVYFMSE